MSVSRNLHLNAARHAGTLRSQFGETSEALFSPGLVYGSAEHARPASRAPIRATIFRGFRSDGAHAGDPYAASRRPRRRAPPRPAGGSPQCCDRAK